MLFPGWGACKDAISGSRETAAVAVPLAWMRLPSPHVSTSLNLRATCAPKKALSGSTELGAFGP
jgi:hypothetical protein